VKNSYTAEQLTMRNELFYMCIRAVICYSHKAYTWYMRTEDDVKGLKLISVIEFDATSSINLKSCVTQDG